MAHEVTVVNAGHLPPLLVDGDGRTTAFDATGPALGLLPDARFDARRAVIHPHAMLLAYSDGVTEAANADDEEFGDARLLDLLMDHASSTATTICRALVDAVRHHTSAPAVDDITVLALRR